MGELAEWIKDYIVPWFTRPAPDDCLYEWLVEMAEMKDHF